MKRSLIIILSLFFAADLWAAAPTWTVENTKVRKVNEEGEVSFDVNIEKLRPNYRVVMTPVLSNGGRQAGARADRRNRQPAQPVRYPQ